MWRSIGLASFISAGMFFFASFSHSTTYTLNSYSIGPGGTNNSKSTTYSTQANVGEISGSGHSTTYTERSGAVQTEQLNTPLAPTVSNGSGTYYNELLVTINTGILPPDTTYAIEVSPSPYTTDYYVQNTGLLGGTPYFQSYTAWGSSGGYYVTGLSNSTSYEVSIGAMQGLFTNTEYGPTTTATTTSPSITFSISPTSISLGNLTAGSVVTSGTNITASLTTDAESGALVFVEGEYGGLHSPTKSYTINGVNGNLATASEGIGLQGVSATDSSGGPFSLISPYNGSANNVGPDSTYYNEVLSTPQEIQSGSGVFEIQAKAGGTDPAASDYAEVLTFSASASF